MFCLKSLQGLFGFSGTKLRGELDGNAIFGDICQIYFREQTITVSFKTWNSCDQKTTPGIKSWLV